MNVRSQHPRPRRGPQRLAVAALLPLSIVLMGADKGCVSAPTPDTIVTTSPVKMTGVIAEYDAAGTFVANHEGQAAVKRNGIWLPWVTTVDKVWTYNAVSLNLGVNLVSGVTLRDDGGTPVAGVIEEFILERKNDLASQGQQKVWLDWSDAGVDARIKGMATSTLTGPLSAADQNAFVTGVKDRVASFFTSAYSGRNVVLVAADGPDVHRVRLHGDDVCSGLFGQSPGDYKSLVKKQTSEIYLGTFECVVETQLINNTPAELSDTLQLRITDIGNLIGRTVAHEVGHSLGLTADGNDKLHGCDGFHNCAAYDNANPSDRFDSGHHIMDPGGTSTLHARIGQCNASGPRQTCNARFEAYGASYLEIVHP